MVTVCKFEAAAVGAPHRRDRVFCVGYAEHNGLSSAAFSGFNTKDARKSTEGSQQTIQPARANIARSNKDVAVPCGERETERGNEGFQQTASLKGTGANNRGRTQEHVSGEWRSVESGLGMLADGLSYWLDGYWRVEPNIPRVATGVKNRVDRLKCLGNAVVPQQVYPILKAIAEIEKESEVEEDG